LPLPTPIGSPVGKRLYSPDTDAAQGIEDEPPAAKEIAMADASRNRGPADPARVNLEDRLERLYWCRKWGVSEMQLRAAVKAAGDSAAAVDRQIQRKKLDGNIGRN